MRITLSGTSDRLIRIIFLAFLFILLITVNSRQAHAAFWVYQLQNANPSELGAGVSVIDYSSDGSDAGQYSSGQIQTIKHTGGTPLSYFSIGEAESYRFYWKDTWVNDDTNNFTGNEPSWLGQTNPDWQGNYKVRYWDTDWRDQQLAPYLDRIITQGFNGVYLDIVDAFEYWADESVYASNGGAETRLATDPFGNELDAAGKMLELISWIKDYSQDNGAGADFQIVPQNGERLLEFDKDRYLSLIDGIGIEDLWYDGINTKSDAEIQERLDILNQMKASGLDVFSVDYVDTGGTEQENIDRIRNFVSLCQASGFSCYAGQSDRELDEINDYLVRADIAPVPVPAAVWLFTSAVIGLAGVSRRRKTPSQE